MISQRYTGDFRVRFDEAGADGRLRPSGWLRFAQDLAWRHSAAVGFDREWYEERDSFWLVRSVELAIDGEVRYGDVVTGTTEVTGWRRVWAHRRTTFADVAGATVAIAETDWVLLRSDGRPMRIPAEITRLLAPGSTYRPRRVETGDPPPDAQHTTTTVRAADVDPLGHLNNAAYLDLADAAVRELDPDRLPAARYRAEYLLPIEADAPVELRAWPVDADTVACRFGGADGRPCFRALIERHR